MARSGVVRSNPHYARGMKVSKFVALSIPDRARVGAGCRRASASARASAAKKFEANKTFGFGLELGYAERPHRQVLRLADTALDFGLGYVYRYYYAGDGLQPLHGLPVAPVRAREGGAVRAAVLHRRRRPVLGLRLRLRSQRRNCGDGGTAFGVRVPIGIAFDFNNIPLDVFIQITPTLDFFRHYTATPTSGFGRRSVFASGSTDLVLGSLRSAPTL